MVDLIVTHNCSRELFERFRPFFVRHVPDELWMYSLRLDRAFGVFEKPRIVPIGHQKRSKAYDVILPRGEP